jgi:hypothetical protein
MATGWVNRMAADAVVCEFLTGVEPFGGTSPLTTMTMRMSALRASGMPAQATRRYTPSTTAR